MASIYTEGTDVELTVQFYNDQDVLTDPTAITLTVRRPDGTTFEEQYPGLNIIRSDVGVYTLTLSEVEAGIWYFRSLGEGAKNQANEGVFIVEPSKVV